MRSRNASGVEVFAVHAFGVDDVPREIGEHDAPGERVFPRAGTKAYMLALLGNPDAQQFEAGGVFGGGGGRVEILSGWPWLHLTRSSKCEKRILR